MSTPTSTHDEFLLLTLDDKKKNSDRFSLVWLDRQEHITFELPTKLRESIKYLIILNNSQKCVQWIKRRPVEETVIIIIADTFVNEILPHIDNLTGIVLYIHCSTVSKDETDEWMKKYEWKIRSITSDYDELIAKLIEDQENRLQIEDETDDLKSISLISSSPRFTNEYSSCMLEGDFLWFQLLIKVLLRMTYRKSDREELIKHCQRVYCDNQQERSKIEEFQKAYTPDQALLWYTKDMCLYRLLNKALRTRDTNTLILFGCFITDLYKQLKQLQSEQCQSGISLVVYRGHFLSADEIKRFKYYNEKNENKHYFSFNSFLSTTLTREVAMMFLPSYPNSESRMNEMYPVLLEIQIDPSIKYVQPYANITHQSQFNCEEEILFMLGSIFRFESFSMDNENDGGIPTIKLQLASESDSKLKNLSRYMKSNLKKKRSNLILLADTLLTMGYYDSAQMYYEKQLRQLTKLHVYKAGQCYAGLAQVACLTRNYNLSIEYQNLALDMARSDSDRSKAYRLLGDVYTEKGYFNNAVDRYNQSLEMDKQLYGEKSVEVAKLYRCLGLSYYRHNMYTEALDYYKLSLEIQSKELPKNHYEIGKTYECMGHVYEERKKWNTSLNCYVKADEIFREALPSYHPVVKQNDENVHRASYVIYRRERIKEKRTAAATTTANENFPQVDQHTTSDDN